MARYDYLAGLNPEQRAAVEHVDGPLLVLAGAGSGKTRVLTTRIVHLVAEHGVDPSSVLAVTFTNKAAGEMRARIRHMLGQEPAGMWIGTFHALGARLLRRHATLLGWSPSFTIYDAEESLREIKRALDRLNLPARRWPPKAIQAAISGAKNQLVDAKAFAESAHDRFNRAVADVYAEYERALRDQNAFDFDDLLVHPVRLFLSHSDVLDHYRRRFQFVLVDEYQDTNHAQFRFLELLAGAHGNLMVVGDDDQSIYGWRGADIRNILEFERTFPSASVIRLEQNYRSTGRILDAANRVIALNRRRKGKTLRTDAGPGELLTLVAAEDEVDEADWIAREIRSSLAADGSRTLRDFAVLYRTNAQSRALEEALRRWDLPYQVVGGTRFYERREIMDVLAYLRLISNPRDAGAFDRIANVPRRGIGDTSKGKILAWAAETGLPIVEAAARADECPGLSSAAVASLQGLAGLILRFRALASETGAGELIEQLVHDIGYLEALQEEGPDGPDRIENVKELIAGAAEFDSRADELMGDDIVGEDAGAGLTPLDRFLQKVALVADVDRHDPEANAVTLMTLHNAKGLEFPTVFLSGMEEGLFPLARSYDHPDTLEEERRLFYVGLTRARRKVYLTHARSRRRAGEVMRCMPSSFLRPIPPELLEERATSMSMDPFRIQAPWRESGRAAPRSGSTRRFGSGDDEPVDVPLDADDVPRFVAGDRVRHPMFGPGIIRELSGFGRDLKAVIEFAEIGRKKVLLRYANLEKVR